MAARSLFLRTITRPLLFRSTSFSTTPPTLTSDVNDLCRILSDFRSPHHDLESALLPFSHKITPQLLDQVLKRCHNLPSSAHRFFLFASSLPNFHPSPLSHQILVQILASSRHFPLVWAHLSDLLHSSTTTNDNILRREFFHLLFRSYSKANLPSDAIRAFKKMPDFGLHPNIDDLHLLLSALCRHNLVKEAQEFFHLTKSRFPINQKTYTVLMQGWASAGNSKEALKLFDEMCQRECVVDVIAYNALLTSLCRGGELDDAHGRLKEMKRTHGLEPDAATYAIFVRAYCEAKDVHSSLRMIENMSRKNLVPNVFSYNCIIKLLCEKEKGEEAYELLDEMIGNGAKPDVWSYNTVLALHCRLREVNRALRLLKRMDGDGCLPDRHTYNMLMKMLIGVGRIDRAVEVWDGMEGRGFYPSASSYAVMIHGLCRKKGSVEEACRYFEVMVDEGIPPYLSTCELLRGELLRLGLRERLDVLADRMRRSTSCTIQELSSAMERSKRMEE